MTNTIPYKIHIFLKANKMKNNKHNLKKKKPNAIIGDLVLTKEYVWFVLFENEYFIKFKTPNKKYV